MAENIFLMQELLKGYNKKRTSPKCTIKVDIRKAYDTISWKFINQVLVGLGLPAIYINWIMETITSVSYSVLINGEMHGFFKGKRGLRQGDPISPTIFILCLEYLSRSVVQATNNSDFNYHPRCKDLNITHLAFADDLMLMARGDQISVKILLNCLEDFGNKSGLKINELKSCIYAAGLEDNTLNSILEAAQLTRGDMPFRYLGVPLAAASLKTINYSPLTLRIADLVTSWRGKTISYAGRVELINSVLQGIYSFWMGIFEIPESVKEQIKKLCRQFYWGSNTNSATVSWESICKPKCEGGLGIKDLKAWNKAMMTKVLWDISQKKDTLWVKWVHQIYMNGDDVWEWQPHKRDSQLMKAIFKLRDDIKGSKTNQEADLLLKSWYNMESKSKTKAAYDFFRTPGTPKPWADVVWCNAITPKYSYTLWMATLKRLKTMERLLKMKVDVQDTKCVFCKDQVETVDHLFFNCTHTSKFWQEIRSKFGMRRLMTTIPSANKWMKKEAKGKSKKAITKKIAYATTVYHLWEARNFIKFEGDKVDMKKLMSKTLTNIYRAVYTYFPEAHAH